MKPIIDQDEWNVLELKVQIYCRTKKARKKNIKKALQLLHRGSCIGTLDNPIVSLTMPIHKNVYWQKVVRPYTELSKKKKNEILKGLDLLCGTSPR